MWEELIKTIKENNTEKAKKITQQISWQELNNKDSEGQTALHLAAYKGMKEVCELLISKMSLGPLMLLTKTVTQHYILLLGRE
jgi:hypothetical protein